MSGDGVLRSLRRKHELQVLAALADRGPCSRRDLEILTGLSRTTMSAIVGELVRRQAILDDVQKPAFGRGRPTTLVRLNPQAGSGIGMELGRGHVSIAVVDLARSVLAHATRPVRVSGQLPERMDDALDLLDTVVRDHALVLDGVAGAVMGLWGRHPDPIGDRVDDDVVADELAERLSGFLKAPVEWDNNIRLAAVAEARHSERPPCRNLVYVALSHGVGAGVVVEGMLARGAAGTAGEIGHLVVVPNGLECWCGQRGCLERYLAVEAVTARVREVAPDIADIDGLVAAVAEGRPAVSDIIEEIAELLGRALGAVATLFDPHRIVVGGELASLGEHLLGLVREVLDRQKLAIRDRRLQLERARISDGAAAVGAALVALDRYAPIHPAP